MPAPNHVENPFEFLLERASWAFSDARRAATAPVRRRTLETEVRIRSIATSDLWSALREGLRDLGVARTDVVFIAIFYPLAGLVLGRMMFSLNMLPLLFPLISGFALLGPLFAIGLYEVSRRLEAGEPVTWTTPFQVFRSPALGSIIGLGAILAVIFFAWLAAAWGIYAATLGPEPPVSLSAFANDVFSTAAGWAMIIVGCAVGFVFAAVSYAISAISFPLLLERDVGIAAAVRASVKAVARNPGPMALWGVIIAGALALGSLPALVGLIFVMPLLGHASWRLYRKLTA
jgi:uncharacterized membrane protein